VLTQASTTSNRAYSIGIDDRVEARFAKTAKQKFAVECNALFHAGGGGVIQDMRMAYVYMSTLIPPVSNRNELIDAVAVLVRYYATAPVSVGTMITSQGSRGGYRIFMQNAPSLQSSVAGEALGIVALGDISALVSTAKGAIDRINTGIPAHSCPDTAVLLSQEEMRRFVIVIAFGVGAQPPSAVTVAAIDAAWQLWSVSSQLEYQSLTTLKALLCAAEDPSFFSGGFADAWYKASTAVSSLSVLSTFDSGASVALASTAQASIATAKAANGRVHRIGRAFHRKAVDALSDEPTDEEWKQSSAASALSGYGALHTARINAATSNVDPSMGDLHRSACSTLSQIYYVDDFEAELYETVVGAGSLEGRLVQLAADLKDAVLQVVTGPSMAQVFPNTELVTQRIQAIRTRIAGAKPGTVLGARWESSVRTRDADVIPSSRDGATALVLKQLARSMGDRIGRAIDPEAHACSHDPLFDALEVNAYHLSPWSCVVLSLGMLVYPFADQLFTTESLLTGVGFILAHEFAHSVVNTPLNMTARSDMLSLYYSSTHEEAIADVIAGMSIAAVANKSFSDLAPRLTQMWCSKVPSGYVEFPGGSHPASYHRISNLCRTLQKENLSPCSWETCV
jgi:hypothetical protein